MGSEKKCVSLLGLFCFCDLAAQAP
jgi:hypothetical protein